MCEPGSKAKMLAADGAKKAGVGMISPAPPPPSPLQLSQTSGNVGGGEAASTANEDASKQRSLSLTSERSTLEQQLQNIADKAKETEQNSGATAATTSTTVSTTASSTASTAAPRSGNSVQFSGSTRSLTAQQKKRGALVKKSIKYFEDKSNRSVSEDNLFTRRKNLAVHLGLDEKVSKKEIQKINTFCLPVPSSATSFDVCDATQKNLVLVEEEEETEEDLKSKNLVHFLGMKDGLTASIASQGTLSDSESPRGSLAQPSAGEEKSASTAGRERPTSKIISPPLFPPPPPPSQLKSVKDVISFKF